MNYMPSSQPARAGYAPVNGLKLYFEVHGPPHPGEGLELIGR